VATDSTGDFEIRCYKAEVARTQGGIGAFEPLTAGDNLGVLFIPPDDAAPPYAVQIWSPSGNLIVDRILRDAPTGRPQSAPPVEFVASLPGQYVIMVKRVNGTSRSEASVRVD
jgi:hypothetical protein